MVIKSSTVTMNHYTEKEKKKRTNPTNRQVFKAEFFNLGSKESLGFAKIFLDFCWLGQARLGYGRHNLIVNVGKNVGVPQTQKTGLRKNLVKI